jgi:Butirosin biosynthesis protein H, N-terminal/Domain of unknown function (DUF4872)
MPPTTEPTLVPGYRHLPGNHCGSTALRNLLGFAGVELSEEMAFGLGAGACFYYLTVPEASPTRWFNGRTARLEESFRELTGAALAMSTFERPEEGWDAARALVDRGRPALLLTDLYHLDYYGRSAHFPGHAVILAGYDESHALLSDTGFEELQRAGLENLGRARFNRHPVYPLKGHLFTVAGNLDRESLLAAVPGAVSRAAREMLEPALGEVAGMPALRRLAAEVASWPETAPDWQWCARFGYQVIEKRGTGGGNFRLMYSRFLEEAGYGEAGLAAEASAKWTALSAAFLEASESEEPEPALWSAIGEAAAACEEAEERLWSALAGGSGALRR